METPRTELMSIDEKDAEEVEQERKKTKAAAPRRRAF
jgi:hypothetical protein